MAASAGKKHAVSVAFDGVGDGAPDVRTPGRIGLRDECMSCEDRIALELDAADLIFGVTLHGRIALEKTPGALGHFEWNGDRQGRC